MLASSFLKELVTTKLLAEKIVMPIHEIIKESLKLQKVMLQKRFVLEKQLSVIEIRDLDHDIEKLEHLTDLLKFEYVLVAVDSIFPRLQEEVEDERSRFLIEKEGYRFRECFYQFIKKFLDIAQKWSFHDDRATRFLKDLEETMQNVIDFIDECRNNGETEP